jgi:hypothetical protein
MCALRGIQTHDPDIRVSTEIGIDIFMNFKNISDFTYEVLINKMNFQFFNITRNLVGFTARCNSFRQRYFRVLSFLLAKNEHEHLWLYATAKVHGDAL